MSVSRIFALMPLAMVPCVCFGYAWRETPSIAKEISEVELVCVAKAQSHHDIVGPDGFIESTRYELGIISKIKGPNQDSISILCPNDSGRFPMIDGHTYLIFANKTSSDGMYFIDATGNSQELRDGK